jgi:hypothetical protein
MALALSATFLYVRSGLRETRAGAPSRTLK